MIQRSCNIKNKLIFPIAAILPVIFMLIAYIRMKFYPFGDKMLYTWDLQGQYSSFMVLMHHLLTGEEHINYSLTGGLGGNLYGLAAYYLGSPFNLIIFFFNERTMPIGIMLLILLKTAFMGLFMFLYLYKRKRSFVAVLFSTAYALSAYAIAYQSNIMWLDALVFLPLVISGVEKLIQEKKCLLYIFSLGMTIISNYYIAYMVCLFVVFYFIGYMLFIDWKKSDFRRKMQTVGRFTAGSLCGGGLSAFLLLPMFCEMQSGIGRENVKWEAIKNGARFFYYRSILPVLLPCSYDNSQRLDSIGTFPLLYCSMIGIFGIILFCLIKNISWNQKIFRFFLLAVILISCNHMNLFFIWHGFYTPMGAPWRFVFLWSFALLTAAYEGTTAFLESEKSIYNYTAVISIGLYFFWVYWRFDAYRRIAVYNMIIICIEIIGLFLGKYGKHRKKTAATVLCIFALGVELVSNSVYTWNQGFEFESRTEYEEYISRMEKVFIEDDGIYRVEITGDIRRNLNDGFLWNLNTIGSYTSTSKKNVYDIGTYLDIGDLRDVRIYNTEASLLAKDIIGLKYIYGGRTADIGYEKIKTTEEGINVFENKHVLPFGFLVNKTALDITSKDGKKDICEKQNALFHALAGSQGTEAQDICKKVPGEVKNQNIEGEEIMDSYIENTDLVQKAVEKTAEYTLSVTSRMVSDITTKIRNDLGETAYVCYSVPYERGWRAKVDGKETEVIEGMGGLLLVPVEEGEHEVKIIYTAPGSRAGTLISLISLMGIAAYFLYIKKKTFQIVGFKVG